MDELYEHEDDASGTMTEGASSYNRRGLLAAAGGFALAASVLLLPRGLDGVEAREGALGGKRGGSHKKHRRRHRHERNHGGQRNHRQPAALFDGINWGYLSSAGAFDIEYWTDRNTKGWVILEKRQVANGHRDAFVTKRTVGILWINRRYFVKAKNYYGALEVTLGHGGSFTSDEGWVGGTRVFDDNVRVGDQADMAVDGFKFAVRRSNDDDDYKYPFLDLYK